MKHLLHLILSLSLTLTAHAQTAAEQQQIIKTISQAAARMKTMQADFVQTKTLRMLGDKMVSYGTMAYQQSDKLRWEYTRPYTYTFILNGNKVTMKKGTRTDVVDVNKNKMFKEIARIMMNSVIGQCLTDRESFAVTVKQDATTYTATLVPQKKQMRQMYSRITLTFNRKTTMVSRVTMYEKNGDNTDITLRNIKTNQPVGGF